MLIFFAATAMVACSKANPNATFDFESGSHRDGWSSPFKIGSEDFHGTHVKKVQSASSGEILFSNRCAVCHGSDAAGKIGPAILSETPSLIASSISSVPLMSGQSDLSQTDIQAISDYIATLAAGGQPASTSLDTASCANCHGSDLDGGISQISCFTCHDGPGGGVGHPNEAWHNGTADPVHFHGSYGRKYKDSCKTCHGVNFEGSVNPFIPGCGLCHNGTIAPVLDFITPLGHPDGWVSPFEIGNDNFHGTGVKSVQPASGGGFLYSTRCAACHGEDAGGRTAISIVSPFILADDISSFIGTTPLMAALTDLSQADLEAIAEYIRNLAGGAQPVTVSFDAEQCMHCHGDDLDGGSSLISCFSCHDGPEGALGQPLNHPAGWETGTADPAHFHGSYGSDFSIGCVTCHGIEFEGGMSGLAPACALCHDGATAPVLNLAQVQLPFTILTTLSGSQEAPPVTTSGTGTGALTVDLVTRAVSGRVSFSGLSSVATASHIHLAPAGVNGPVEIGLIGGEGATQGTWVVPAGTVFTQAQFDALLADQLYFNVHTEINRAGEIRGQIIFPRGGAR
ncbi:MAG: CHRD domain-containing protein [Nitrospirae bacterium]|nr:CHRD domain-containing protein [Nitrospirota bacterium]